MATSIYAENLAQIAESLADLELLAVQSNEMFLATLIGIAALQAKRSAANLRIPDGDGKSG